jgi:hypothetical protein
MVETLRRMKWPRRLLTGIWSFLRRHCRKHVRINDELTYGVVNFRHFFESESCPDKLKKCSSPLQPPPLGANVQWTGPSQGSSPAHPCPEPNGRSWAPSVEARSRATPRNFGLDTSTFWGDFENRSPASLSWCQFAAR